MYDLNYLKELADVVEVAEALGIPTKNTGNRISILCPSHDDEHFGSAFLVPGGYVCYACGQRGDVFALVKATLHCSFKESVEFVAKLYGVSVQRTTDLPSLRWSKLRLTEDEQRIINVQNLSGVTLKTLCMESESFYKEAIAERAEKAARVYADGLRRCCFRDADEIDRVLSMCEPKTPDFAELRREFRRRIDVCRTIMERMRDCG